MLRAIAHSLEELGDAPWGSHFSAEAPRRIGVIQRRDGARKSTVGRVNSMFNNKEVRGQDILGPCKVLGRANFLEVNSTLFPGCLNMWPIVFLSVSMSNLLSDIF